MPMSTCFLLLADEPGPGITLALIAIVMAALKLLEHVVPYLVGELKRRRDEEDGKKPRGKRKDSGKHTPDAILLRIETLLEELYKWHAVDAPSQPGVKVWWNSEEQRQQLKDIVERLERTGGDVTKISDAQRRVVEKLYSDVEDLRQKIEQLHDQRIADRDMLYERVIRIQEAFAKRIERGLDFSGSGPGLVSTIENEAEDDDDDHEV